MCGRRIDEPAATTSEIGNSSDHALGERRL
jgi:hypothetical protein